MKETNCTILVCSCDDYMDCWPPFFHLLKKYWPDCPYDIVLNTESEVFTIDGLHVVCHQFYNKGENVPYGERLLRHLNAIDTPYIFILMDDFFLRKEVDTAKIQFCIHELERNSDIAVFSFDSVRDEMNIDDGQYSDFLLRPQCGEYKLNFQGGGYGAKTYLQVM